MLLIFQSCTQHDKNKQINKSNYHVYENAAFKIKAQIPGNFKLYKEMVNDNKNKLIVIWDLPSVYSEFEETNIVNAVSITAFISNDIHSVYELIQYEYLNLDPIKTAMEIDSTTVVNSRIIYSTEKGLEYKGKSYFVFNNGICYEFNFTATYGTFNKNLKVFEEFYKRIKYI